MHRYLLVLLTMLLMCSASFAYEVGTQAKIQVDGASYMAVDGQADLVAVVSKKNQTLSVVDTKSHAIVKEVPLATPLSGVAIVDGKIAVAGVYGQIWLYEKTGEIVAMVNTDARINSMVVAGQQTVMAASNDAVKAIDVVKGELREVLRIQGRNPRLYPAAERVFVTEEFVGGTRVSAYHKTTGMVTATDIAGNVTGLAVDEELGYMAATMSGKTALSLFNSTTMEGVGEIETNRLIANLSINASTHTVVAASLTDGSMVVIGLESKMVEKTYPLFDSIAETAIDQSRNVALAALSDGLALIKLENPVPVLQGLSPDAAEAGKDGVPLAILGKKFLKETEARFNNKPIDVFFDSNQVLKSNILPDDLIYPGEVAVTAVNPTPGGGTSHPVIFKIVTPIPQITGISPAVVEVNAASVVRVAGKNFLPNAKVSVDGTPVETYFVSSIVLEGRVTPELASQTGVRKVTVVNTGQSTATSNPVDLVVSSSTELQERATSDAAGAVPVSLGSLRGRVLNTRKEPVANVTVSYKGLSAKTGADGTFLLNGIPEGRRTVLIDGSTAIGTKSYYPAIPVTAEIVANTVTQLNFTPHLHHQKNRDFVAIDAGQDTIVTDPDMPGFQATIPKGVRIIGWDGKVNDKVNMRTVPPDRLPIRPLPENSYVRAVSMFYFDKVGGGRPDRPIPFKSPNTLRLLPGEKATLWYYDESSADGEAANDWAIAGTGTVSRDGRYIVTDPGVGIPKFCCGATAWGGPNPPPNLNRECIGECCGASSSAPSPGAAGPGAVGGGPGAPGGPGPVGPPTPQTCGGDPIDASTGFFFHNETDMLVPGIIPIIIKRHYVSRYSGSAVSSTGSDGLGSFGKGMAFQYDWRVDSYQDMIRLTMPGGQQADFALQPDGVTYRNMTDPAYAGGKITIINGQRVLTTRDGWQYVFETAGGIISLADAYGNTVTFSRHYNSHDQVGYLTKITTAEGKEIQFNQTADGQYFVRTDSIVGPDGRAVNYVYETDPFSVYPRLKRVLKPDGSTISYGYDAQGRMNTLTDGNGVVKFTNVYDANNRAVTQTRADGGVSTFSYTVAGGNVTQTDMTEPNGSVKSWRFNAYGRIPEYTTPEGTTTYDIDSGTNQIRSITDPLDRTTHYFYYSTSDARNGMVSSITDHEGNIASFDYDPVFGWLTRTTNELGKSFTTAYTFSGAKVTKTMTTDALSNQTTVNYDGFGMPSSVIDPLGHATTMTYDASNRSQLVSVADPLGNTTAFSYDASGRIASTTDAKGATSSFRYDNGNRIVSSIDAMGNSTGYTYDKNGNLLTLTDVKGNTTTYQYDNMNRLVKTTDRLGRSERYSYYTGTEITPTTGTNLKSYTDKRGLVTTFDSYDAMNRLMHVTFGDGSTIQYSYDAAGRLTSISDSVSGTISYTYDTQDRIARETTPAGTIDYTYDALGRRATMTVAGEPSVSYGYDDANRLISISRLVGGVIRTYALGYDNAGRRSSLRIPLAATGDSFVTDYSFDHADRLESIVHQSPVGVLETVSYTLDPNGNRTSMGRSASVLPPTAINGTSYNREYEMLSHNGNALTYDENGNLATEMDADGNVTTYTWDARSRLVAISTPTAIPPLAAAFQYDALNRRIGKTVNGATTTYLYDGADIIQETTNGGKTSYIRTLRVDDPLTSVVDGSTVSHYLRDGLGSVIGSVDDGGNPISLIAYDPYGNSVSTESFGFTGREWDKGAGLYYYRARYYNPMNGRFISRDPLGFDGGDVNFYAYVKNNAINNVDPTGLSGSKPGSNAVPQPQKPNNQPKPSSQQQCKKKPSTLDLLWWATVRAFWNWRTPPFTPAPPGYGDDGPGTTDPRWGNNKPDA